MRPPCEQHPEFTDPGSYAPETLTQAITMCHHCPLLVDCAKQALTSGGTLDRSRVTPATGVIQAGVHCQGDRDTAKQLATIAGVTLPATEHHPRFVPPNHCKGCGEHMVTRDKTKPTQPDVLTHGAHGYCRICDARRRRQPGWKSPQPRHLTILEGKHGKPHNLLTHRPGGTHPDAGDGVEDARKSG